MILKKLVSFVADEVKDAVKLVESVQDAIFPLGADDNEDPQEEKKR